MTCSGLFIPPWRHAPWHEGVVPGAFADAERYGALAEADAALRPWTPTRLPGG